MYIVYTKYSTWYKLRIPVSAPAPAPVPRPRPPSPVTRFPAPIELLTGQTHHHHQQQQQQQQHHQHHQQHQHHSSRHLRPVQQYTVFLTLGRPLSGRTVRSTPYLGGPLILVFGVPGPARQSSRCFCPVLSRLPWLPWPGLSSLALLVRSILTQSRP
jgi:hypothetical protein